MHTGGARPGVDRSSCNKSSKSCVMRSEAGIIGSGPSSSPGWGKPPRPTTLTLSRPSTCLKSFGAMWSNAFTKVMVTPNALNCLAKCRTGMLWPFAGNGRMTTCGCVAISGATSVPAVIFSRPCQLEHQAQWAQIYQNQSMKNTRGCYTEITSFNIFCIYAKRGSTVAFESQFTTESNL